MYVSAGQMSSQLLKTATVALTHVTTTDTATVKPSAASVPSQVTVASASSCSVPAQQSALPAQSVTSVTKLKPAESASSALNKTFEKDPHGSDS